MEKEEQKLGQADMEEQEEEETDLLVRKSRNGNDSKTTEIAVDVEVSDGVYETNGHAIQSEVAENGVENKELISPENGAENEELTSPENGVENEELLSPENEQKIEKHNGVLENESEAINVEQKSHNLVFYDDSEGIWKCGICPWTHGNGSVCADHIQDHKGQWDKLMNLETSSSESEGVESTSAYLGEKQILKDPEPIEGSTNYVSSKEIESADIHLINDDDLEVTELDVEGVLQKQTTHDLYCPNCNSCITKRVILRKRKRTIRTTGEEIKRNKTETALLRTASAQPGDPATHVDEVGDNYVEISTANEDERDRGPDIFRCLSCFSFFIPSGNGFKLFRIFREKSGKENVQDEQAPSIKKNWLTSMFAPKQETAVGQGSSSRTDIQKAETAIPSSSNLGDQSGQPLFLQEPRSPAHTGINDTQEGGATILPSPNQKPSVNGKVAVVVEDKLDTKAKETVDPTMDKFDGYTTDQSKESNSSQEVRLDREVQIPNQTVQAGVADKEVIQVSSTSVSVVNTSDDGKVNISVSIPHEEHDVTATILTESVIENVNANFGSSESGQIHPTEVSQHVTTKTKIEVHSSESPKFDSISALKGAAVAPGEDAVIMIDPMPATSSQTVKGTVPPTGSLSQSATQSSDADSERTEERKELEIEVIKSTVYGGLAESITSLSVVTSAASGGAATLNVLALAAANLIGGFFVICHNLWDLKSYRVEQVSNQIVEQRDRYRELLGRRRNFMIHATVAIISYLVSGLVPPLVYGFSFRKSDDQQLKLVAVAAASIFIVLILAIGKAYTETPPKPYLQTLTRYLVLGFMVSGVSYASGQLAERLLEKLGLFQTGSVPNLVVPEMRQTGSGWASY